MARRDAALGKTLIWFIRNQWPTGDEWVHSSGHPTNVLTTFEISGTPLKGLFCWYGGGSVWLQFADTYLLIDVWSKLYTDRWTDENIERHTHRLIHSWIYFQSHKQREGPSVEQDRWLYAPENPWLPQGASKGVPVESGADAVRGPGCQGDRGSLPGTVRRSKVELLLRAQGSKLRSRPDGRFVKSQQYSIAWLYRDGLIMS